MVDIAAPLKPHQLEVLRWVEAGCPDAGMPGDGAKRTARALQGRRLVTVSRRDGALEQDPTNLQVAPESIPLVLGLLRAVDDAGADRKCRVGVNLTTKNLRPFVKVGGARWSLDIVEEYDQVPHVLTADERRTKRLRPWAHIPEFDRVATGRLRLETGKVQPDQRLTWRDTATSTLEQQANRIVADIIKAVEKKERASAAIRPRDRNARQPQDLPNSRQPKSAAAATSNAKRGGSTPSRKPAASPSKSVAGRHSTPRWNGGRPP